MKISIEVSGIKKDARIFVEPVIETAGFTEEHLTALFGFREGTVRIRKVQVDL